ncbi:hypothetical protein PISMIDRAFT_29233 [Pisolithus microcarpus 441]|uniref:Uncharacterized protein n=1 Tax=Pisolithus microcarpus 441 TaxID=765257 RepID=A0A0C9ZE15_9AGAM|nr:hypothetical protein BKA83DRAFT_29233 [Pisolithus microcarpus]KIK24174.1 hypothetical protein PISMIDRAFT_29233 [Pisolithus microcarpus 441]
MAKVIPLFHGDYGNREEPMEWFAQFQLSVPDLWSETRKVDCFGLQLAPGSYADNWFMDLPSEDKEDMRALKAAFIKRWPLAKHPKLTRVQQRERVKDQWIEEGCTGDYGHMLWAEKVKRLVLSMGDAEGTLIVCTIEGAPQVLRDELDKDYSSWEEFVTAVRNIKQMSNLSIQMGSISAREAARPMPATQPQGQLIAASQQGFTTQGASWGLGLGMYQRAQQVPLTRLQILKKVNAILHRPNTEAGRCQYKADIEVWHKTHGYNAPPSLERPYPLKPGTVAAGTGECFMCGLITEPPHVGSMCTANETLHPHETHWRQLIAGMLHRAMQTRLATTQAGYHCKHFTIFLQKTC